MNTTIPAIGRIFEYNGRRYRCSGWMSIQTIFRRDRISWCTQEEAQAVTGSGVAGCIAPISEITLLEMVPWSDEMIQEAHDSAVNRANMPESEKWVHAITDESYFERLRDE